MKKRRWLRVLCWVLLALCVWTGAFIGRIAWFGAQDRAAKCDAIIVLGAALHKGEPSPAFAARIRHGVELWKNGIAPKLVFTGGLGHGSTACESEVARRVAMEQGVPGSAILIEKESRITWENLIEARRVMHASGLRSAVIVSDPAHLLLASMMADALGMQHTTSPTPHTAFKSWQPRAKFLINEFWHCHAFRVSLWLGLKKVPVE